MNTHSMAIKVDVYPDEFKPLIKLINRALHSKDIVDELTGDEASIIVNWLDDFKSTALEHAS